MKSVVNRLEKHKLHRGRLGIKGWMVSYGWIPYNRKHVSI